MTPKMKMGTPKSQKEMGRNKDEEMEPRRRRHARGQRLEAILIKPADGKSYTDLLAKAV